MRTALALRHAGAAALSPQGIQFSYFSIINTRDKITFTKENLAKSYVN